MRKEIEITIESKEDSLPVKAVLSKRVGLSRREISRLKFSHGLLLNGKECRVTEIVHTGDTVLLIFPEKDLAHAARIIGTPEILYEDEDLVIVNKPAGMVAHPSHEHLDDDMGTLLQNYYQKDFTIRAIGRLDKDVSGIMVYAKSQIAASRLSKQRNEEHLHKIYHAIVEGHFSESQGTLKYALEKVEGRKERKISSNGKPCITHYKVLKEYDQFSLIEVSIETGRTHQIRAGMAYAKHPLLGDRLYGGDDSLISRPALHCYSIDLLQPFTQETIHVELPEEEDMQKILKNECIKAFI